MYSSMLYPSFSGLTQYDKQPILTSNQQLPNSIPSLAKKTIDILPFSLGLCPVPCQNGGVCNDKNLCQCAKGYLGQFCQKREYFFLFSYHMRIFNTNRRLSFSAQQSFFYTDGTSLCEHLSLWGCSILAS